MNESTARAVDYSNLFDNNPEVTPARILLRVPRGRSARIIAQGIGENKKEIGVWEVGSNDPLDQIYQYCVDSLGNQTWSIESRIDSDQYFSIEPRFYSSPDCDDSDRSDVTDVMKYYDTPDQVTIT